MSVLCKECRNPKSSLKPLEDIQCRQGLSQKFVLKCNTCHAEKILNSSKRLADNKTCTVNMRSVHAGSQGMGLAGVKRFCTSMDLPQPITPMPYNKLLNRLLATSVNQEKYVMHTAVRIIWS